MQRDSDLKVISHIENDSIAISAEAIARPYQSRVFQEAERVFHAEGVLLPHEKLRTDNYTLANFHGIKQSLYPPLIECEDCGHVNDVELSKLKNNPGLAYSLSKCRRKACESTKLRQVNLVIIHECGLLMYSRPKPCRIHGWEYIKMTKGRSQQIRDIKWTCAEGGCDTITREFFVPHMDHASCNFSTDDNGNRQPPMARPYQDPSIRQGVNVTLINHGEGDWAKLADDPAFVEQLLKVFTGNDEVESLFGARWTSGTAGDKQNELLQLLATTANLTVSEVKQMIISGEGQGVFFRGMLENQDPSFKLEYLEDSGQKTYGIDPAAVANSHFRQCVMDYLQLFRPERKPVSWNEWEGQATSQYGMAGFPLEETRKTIHELGLADVTYTEKFPVAHVSLGYTRGRFAGKKAVQQYATISADDPRTPFYLHDLETEALIFSLDPLRVVHWLEGRGHDITATTKEEAIVALANSLNHDELEAARFEPINDDVTRDLYTLMHTFSHAMLKTVNEFGGDDNTSFSEILLPSVPAFIIYLNKRSKFTNGSVQYTFQRNMLKWFKKAKFSLGLCMNDPTCRSRGNRAACYSCVEGSEIGCTARNRYLDRRTLYPLTDNALASYWDL